MTTNEDWAKLAMRYSMRDGDDIDAQFARTMKQIDLLQVAAHLEDAGAGARAAPRRPRRAP